MTRAQQQRQRKEGLRLIALGLQHRQVALLLGKGRSTVSAWAIKSGLPFRHARRNPVDTGIRVEAIMRLVNEKRLKYKEIGRELGCSHQTVGRVAREHGVMRTGFERRLPGRPLRVPTDIELRARELLADRSLSYSVICRMVGWDPVRMAGTLANIAKRAGLLRGRGTMPPGRTWQAPNRIPTQVEDGILLGIRAGKTPASMARKWGVCEATVRAVKGRHPWRPKNPAEKPAGACILQMTQSPEAREGSQEETEMAGQSKGYTARRITHVELLDWNGHAVTAKVTLAQGDYLEAKLEDGTLIAYDKKWFVPNSSPSPSVDDFALTETGAW